MIERTTTMEVERMRQLLLLWCKNSFVALVGANHTAARAMELADGFAAKHQNKVKHLHGGQMGLDSGTYLVINLPDSKALRIIWCSVFLGLVILSLPCFGTIQRGLKVSQLDLNFESENFNFKQLGLLFRDLAGEGLRRKGDTSLIVAPGNAGTLQNLHPFDFNGFDFVVDSESVPKSSFLDESMDFVFAFNLADAKFADRILKIGGIVAVPISIDPSNAFRPKPNYKIVYLRRYAATFVAMRKISPAYDLPVTSRRLCQLETEEKKTVLEGLEDVLLEPPRLVLAKSNEYLKKIKFLPELLGDSLDSYNRRVFVNVDLNEENRGMIEWFDQNYPKMNNEFEVYNLEVEPEEASSTPENDVSDWLKDNVREEDYVVMKAEAEVVVDMVRKRTICLVDELFLECSNGWWQSGRRNGGSKRAYWECIALYGRLRDLGVAVHQWFM
ncbi:hypothetical protein TB2_011921 [Malus domestica]